MMLANEVHAVLMGKRIGVLYHANTVTTSCTFLAHGGLLSRQHVEERKLEQTAQSTDDIDKRYSIWNHIFVDHCDIHSRVYKTKGVNHYGPVLFKLDTSILLDSSVHAVHVTRSNPSGWPSIPTVVASGSPLDPKLWFQSASELKRDLVQCDFNQIVVIETFSGRLPFAQSKVEVVLDDPNRSLLQQTGGAYKHAYERLKRSAEAGGLTASISKRLCDPLCKCKQVYGGQSDYYFQSRFE